MSRLILVSFLFGAVVASGAEKVLAPSQDSGQFAAESTQQFPRPIPMGSSCGNTPSLPFIYTGTCGMRVRSWFSADLKFILSNNHVLGAQGPTICPNTAIPGQTITLQPGTLDIGGQPADPTPFAVGVVAGFIPMSFNPGANNVVDVALSITNSSLAGTEIVDLGNPTQAVGVAAPGMQVVKTGRTTDTTNGVVDAVNVTANVSFGDCGIVRYVGQVSISPGSFSAGGDSGSVILESATNTPVALLFAGSATRTIGNPILAVYLATQTFVDAPDVAAAGAAPITRESLLAAAAAKADPRVQALAQVQREFEPMAFARPGVVGVGVGMNRGGTGLALIVYTQGAAATAARALPRNYRGVPVRIVQNGAFRAYNW